jgi:hypothetical protein
MSSFSIAVRPFMSHFPYWSCRCLVRSCFQMGLMVLARAPPVAPPFHAAESSYCLMYYMYVT